MLMPTLCLPVPTARLGPLPACTSPIGAAVLTVIGSMVAVHGHR